MEGSNAVTALLLAAVFAVSLLAGADSASAAGTRITVSNSEFGPML